MRLRVWILRMIDTAIWWVSVAYNEVEERVTTEEEKDLLSDHRTDAYNRWASKKNRDAREEVST